MTLQQKINSLWTTADLCARFGVTPMAIFYWRRDKALPVVVIPSQGRNAVRYEPAKIRQWARRNGYALRDNRSTIAA